MGEMEFRFNFVLWSISNTFWALLLIFTVQLIYGQVDTIAGWGRNDAYVLAIVNSLFISFLWSFVLPSMVGFHNLTRKGQMDFILLKPLSTRFLASARTIEFDMYPRILVLCILLINFVSQHYSAGFLEWFWFTLSIGAGVVIFYNFALTAATTNFWFINIFNLENLFDAVYDLGRLPLGIFKGGLQLVFIYFIPMAFLGTYSSQILLGMGSWAMLFSYLIAIVTTSWVSQWFWNFALKRYSSASS